MKVFKLILGIVFVVLLLIAFWWAALDDNYYVQRQILIKATPAQILANTNNFKNWKNFSPWTQADPNAKFTFEGEDGTVGSSMRWDSKVDTMGVGTMTITEIAGEDSMRYLIVFEQPWQMESFGGFNFEASDSGTLVTWFDKADLPFEMRPVGKMIDDMIGPNFERGLAQLKEISEASTMEEANSSSGDNSMDMGMDGEEMELLLVEESKVESYPYLSSTDSCTVENLSQTLGMLYAEVMNSMGENNVKPAGFPFAIYHTWDGKSTRVEAGIPINRAKRKLDVSESYGGKVLKVVYTGPYNGTEQAHYSIDKYATDNELEIIGSPWEIYVTDPSEEPDTSKWITEVYYPIK